MRRDGERTIRSALITGATGFIGRALTAHLLSTGIRIKALVRDPANAAGLANLGASIVPGNLEQPQTLARAIGDVDTVFHAAALTGPPELPLARFVASNVTGTANLTRACLAAPQLERFIHISTVAVVGSTDPRAPSDETCECFPTGAYGATKLQAEGIVLDAVKSGLPAVIARPMWVYGPESISMTRLFQAVSAGKFYLIGRAQNTLQPVYIDDLLTGLVRCAVVPEIEGNIYNLCGGEILEIQRVCEIIASATGSRIPALRFPMPLATLLAALSERLFQVLRKKPPLTRHKLDFFRVNHAYQIDKARRDLGWIPAVGFAEGAQILARKINSPDQPALR